MFLTFPVDLENGRLNATSSLQKEWQHTKGRMQKVAMQEAESDRIKRFGSAHFAAKMHSNFMKNHAKTSQNPSKIDQNGAQERSESDLGNCVEKMHRPGQGF